MAQVCAHHPTIRALGAELGFVGSGTPAMAQAFQAERCPDARVYVDPGRRVYQAFDLRRGLLRALAPRAIGAALTAYKQGHRQGAVLGDAAQHGGAFVIDVAGQIQFAQRSRGPGDHVEPEALLTALRSLRDQTSGSPS